jgi:transposase InsO family protein
MGYMAYSTNPQLPTVRMQAVRLIEAGWSTREVARHLGFDQSAIVRWVARAKALPHNVHSIATRSSRPEHHPRELPVAIVRRILELRSKRNECAEIIHHYLSKEGVSISLSSIKRTLRRHSISRFSKWKKWHQYPERPVPEKPGILVEIDTIHSGPHECRLYIYTMLDVCSRYAYAIPTEKITTHWSLRFVERATGALPFPIQTLQSDNGPEFSKWFTAEVERRGIAHRHSRVRQPNDNAHLERFNRTIQEQCIVRLPRKLSVWKREIPDYLCWYNEKRPHMGLSMKSPNEVLKVMRSY